MPSLHHIDHGIGASVTVEEIVDSYKKLGHILGLQNFDPSVYIKRGGRPEYKSEGTHWRDRSLTWIRQTLDTLRLDPRFGFNEEAEKRFLDRLSTAFMWCSDQPDMKQNPPQFRLGISEADKENNIEFLRNNKIIENVIKKGEPFIFPTGWQGHAIGMSIIGNRLLVTNTGEECNKEGITFESGTAIYEIDPEKLTEENIASLMQGEKSSDYIKQAIQNIVKENSDPIINPHKQQKVGNCSVSNPKKMMEELIACMKAFDDSKENSKNAGGVTQVSNDSIREHLSRPETSRLFKKITGKDDVNSNQHGMRGVAMLEWKGLGRQINDQKIDIPILVQRKYRELNEGLNKQSDVKYKQKKAAIIINNETLLDEKLNTQVNKIYNQEKADTVINKESLSYIKHLDTKSTINQHKKMLERGGVKGRIDTFGRAIGLGDDNIEHLKEIYDVLSKKNIKKTKNNNKCLARPVNKDDENSYGEFIKWVGKIELQTPRQSLLDLMVFFNEHYRNKLPRYFLPELADITKKISLDNKNTNSGPTDSLSAETQQRGKIITRPASGAESKSKADIREKTIHSEQLTSTSGKPKRGF